MHIEVGKSEYCNKSDQAEQRFIIDEVDLVTGSTSFSGALFGRYMIKGHSAGV
jgi:hypothetical protein